ncbi:MAG TPA: hypothetical protein VFB08_04580 [Burkholderiales bacterium]|nr:hypothetical protein [Burkholderiales bacterium]
MNALHPYVRDPRRRRLEADLAERIAHLFREWPELSGFTVQEESPLPGSLVYGRVPDVARAEALLAAVTQMLLDLVDEEPEAPELVLGRTFARTLH